MYSERSKLPPIFRTISATDIFEERIRRAILLAKIRKVNKDFLENNNRKERSANRKKYDPKTMEKSYGDQYSAEVISICYNPEAEMYYYQNVFCANTKVLAFRMIWYPKREKKHTQQIIEHENYCEIVDSDSLKFGKHKAYFDIFFRNLQTFE